ncbi:MAG: polyribonucleotide nucleotidyltransferase [Thermoguttaceae bacterium]
MKVRIERQIGASTLSIETGELAKQAAGSCLVQYGETVVLTASASGAPRPGDFFPLTCDYRERVAAAGKFPGGFLKREGRPTTKETLTSRLMDRPIRPLFPEWYMDEVQVLSTVLASDRQNDPDVLAMNGASASLCVSPLPFQGPIGSIRLGFIDGEIIPFPTHNELERSDLDLIVSGNKDSILMIEGFASEMPEDKMAECILAAHQYIRQICEMQEELIAKAGKPKTQYPAPEPNALIDKLKERCYDALRAAKQTEGKQARADACTALKQKVAAEMIPDIEVHVAEAVFSPAAKGAITPEAFKNAWDALEQRVVRDLILSGTRADGRDYKKLRLITCQVDLLPRVHGSALFQRGETQALATVTLGTGRDEQRVDGLLEEYTQKFMLHYYFPPYSVGECRPIRGPGRREIGHGALAERSIKPVLPDPNAFPYTIRIISDVLESNGSSSMATVCAATLALMAAGVPISNPVAGISIGLLKEPDRYVLLTDILGEEDHYGDMDFKISGTQNGITGIQLDLKIKGIDEEIVKNTLVQAREARIEILRTMLTIINRPRSEISHWAPRLLRTRIDPEKIGLLIGPGGKMIRSIQDATGAVIEVEDDGTVTVACNKMEGAKDALQRIEALTASVEIGKIYDGRVTSVKDFGAFVEIIPGKDGLCHISELADEYVSSVADVCKVGDPMQVKVISIDDQDRVKLSRRAAMRELNPKGGDGNRGRS